MWTMVWLVEMLAVTACALAGFAALVILFGIGLAAAAARRMGRHSLHPFDGLELSEVPEAPTGGMPSESTAPPRTRSPATQPGSALPRYIAAPSTSPGSPPHDLLPIPPTVPMVPTD